MKSAVVTGAGAGLGADIARYIAGQNYRVGVLDVSTELAEKTARKIPNAVALTADVSDEVSVAAALESFGEVPDLLVNNAGIVRFGTLLEQSADDFRATISVNLIGCYLMSAAVARGMADRGSGNIVNITSINGISPGPGTGGYGASKSGIATLTAQMAIEWGPLGLRINAVAPGFIDAGMSAPIYADPKIRASRGGAVPSRRLGLASDVAKAVMYLASDDAAYVNGHQLVVDGGVVQSVIAQLPRE